jgi:PAS domain S-box-containing protein
MNENPSTPVEDEGEKIFTLVRLLDETEQRLRELTGGEVDSILSPSGQSFLLRDAQEKLRQNDATQSSILNAVPANIALLDRSGIIVSVNEGWRRFAGGNALQDEAVGVGQNYLEVCERAQNGRANEAQKIAAGIRSVLDGRETKFELEYPCHSPTEQRWFRLLVTPTGEDRERGAVVMHLNITERKRFEHRFRRLLDSNAQAVFFWNTKGEISDCNDAFLTLTGYTREDLQAGRIGWAAMTPPEYADQDERALKEVTTMGVGPTYEKEYIRKDGSRVPILIGSAIFEDNRDEGVAFVLDLTERKKIEAQFRQAQKMEGIGQLAGGVAHDFNNILAVIQMQADLLNTESTLSAEQLGFAKGIAEAAQHGSNLTRQLLMFSRKQTMQPHELDLSETINNMTNLLRRTLGEHIELQFKFSMEPLFIHADAGMIDQVLLNLAVNARDAMPDGGKIIIETTAVEFDESTAAQSMQIKPGKFICLSVSDSGTGIAPENLPRIFEPFFTTKETGKGTGLGLATVFGIVQEHKGWINVYSEHGQGTTFRIYLPRLDRISGQKSVTPAMELGRGGNETILLVEDKTSLRDIIKIALSRLGYRVLEAANGVEAIEIWKLHRDEIHLLFTDIMMPSGINGFELAAQLLETKPKLKVIYASGYSAEVAGKDLRLKEGVNFLTKPFQTSKLAQIIREGLDAKSSH